MRAFQVSCTWCGMRARLEPGAGFTEQQLVHEPARSHAIRAILVRFGWAVTHLDPSARYCPQCTRELRREYAVTRPAFRPRSSHRNHYRQRDWAEEIVTQ